MQPAARPRGAPSRDDFAETVVEAGVDAAPQAFIDLLAGANTGKMLVKPG